MLGSLARKLRAFGFDVTYYRDGNDSELLALAAREGRTLLTADLELSRLASARGIPSIPIRGKTDSARLVSLRAGAEASRISLAGGPPRCSVCNGQLEVLSRSEAVGMVPLTVVKRHRRFYRCVDCGRFYWKGGHWKKLRWLERRLSQTSDAHIPRRR
jgi:uncharacterized protein with PIN domain